MVLGIGVDLVSVRRLQSALERHPRLYDRLFRPEELGQTASLTEMRSLAARFAAKEATRKALGARAGEWTWHDAYILGGRGTRPRLELSGGLLRAAAAMNAAGWQVSLSHERDYAVAVVVIEE